MSKLESEVPALLSAVLEYKKFRQLACYSIECVTKVVAPTNRDYKRNLQIAFGAQAPKCIVEVLRVHIDKEDCLLVCVDCLHKLAIDDDNAEAIAREGGIRAVLASIGSIPTITEDALCEAMAILDTLCNHKRALEILADNDNVGAVIDLVKKKTASSKVKVNCMRALDKLTRLPKGIDSFMCCNGIPELLTLISDYKSRCDAADFDEIDLETLTIATKILLRLCKANSVVVDQLLAANGAETYVGVLGALTDLPPGHLQDPESGGPLDMKDCLFSRLAAKLISSMYSGRISELVKSLKNSSQLNEFTLNLLGSLAMDASSSLGIVSNGGIEILLLGCCGDNTSTKILEVSTRALSRLAGNVSNLAGLVNQGAIEGLISALRSSQGSLASATDAISGLTLICSTGEYIERVCELGGLSAVLTCLTGVADSADGDEAKKKEIIMAGLSFLEQIAATNLDGDENQPSLLLSMSKVDIWAVLSIIQKYHGDIPLVSKAIRVVAAYIKANPGHGLLEDAGDTVSVVPLMISLLAEHAIFDESETAVANDSSVGLVDEVLRFLCSLLMITATAEGVGKSRRQSIRTSQALVMDQQRAVHSTQTWKNAADSLISQGDGIVNVAISAYLERTTTPSLVESMNTFKMYSSDSLVRCAPLISLWADGGSKSNPSPVVALVAQITAFAEAWAAGTSDMNTFAEKLASVHSAVVSLGLFASVHPSHPAVSMLASEYVVEKLFFLIYAVVNSPLTAAAIESENGGLVGAVISATCLSSIHIIGALHSLLFVPGDENSESSFLQLLGDPLSAVQLCVDVLKSPLFATMSTSLQALRLLWILERVSNNLIGPYLVEIGGIEALSAILKATGPMAAAAANAVQVNISFGTVVTVVQIVATLFKGISHITGVVDGATELSRKGGVKTCLSSFIDPVGAPSSREKATTAGAGGDMGNDASATHANSGSKEGVGDRIVGYSIQCAESALQFLHSIENVAMLGEDECAILSKMGCVMLLFRLCDRFEDNLDIFETTNRIVQLLVTPFDMLSVLESIKSKYASSATVGTLFGAKCTSDGMERAIREVNRLCHFMGLLPMVEAFLENGGIIIIQACISNIIDAIADARSKSGPTDLLQLRGNFLNACVRVLCRASATRSLDGATDTTVKLVCEHLVTILKKANEESSVIDSTTLLETLQSIVRLANSIPVAASYFYSGGAVGLLVKRLQLSAVETASDGQIGSECMELCVTALAAICRSCPYTYDYLLSTFKLIKQICVCVSDYVLETGGVTLPPWVTMAAAFLAKIFNALHECSMRDENAIAGQGGVPSVELLLLVLRTAGVDIYNVLLNFKGNQLMNAVIPSTHTMDILTNVLLSTLNINVNLSDEDKAAIGYSYGEGDLSTATCYGICTTLLTSEVTAIPKCTQLLRRIWLASSGSPAKTLKKKDLEVQLSSYLALLRAYAGVSGGSFASQNLSMCNLNRKMMNQTGVNKLLIAILSGGMEISPNLVEDMESTLSLLSDEDYGENALQSFAEYITALAASLTPEGYLDCAVNHIRGTAPELVEGEEDAVSTVAALRNTLKLLQRFLQRGTQLTVENVSTLSAAAQAVSRKLFDCTTYLDSNGYTHQQLSKAQSLELSNYHDGLLDVIAHALSILNKLFASNFGAMDAHARSSAFDFSMLLVLVNDVLSGYLAILERQYDVKTSEHSHVYTFKMDLSVMLQVCGTTVASIFELNAAAVDITKGTIFCENVMKSGLAESLHKISALNASCNGVTLCAENASNDFLQNLKFSTVQALNALHDCLLANTEMIVALFPMYETQAAIAWRMCDMGHTTANAVQMQRRAGCVSWIHIACGTVSLTDSLLGMLDIVQNKLLVGRYCSDGVSSLYSLDLDGAIAYILHALAEYRAQGISMPPSLSTSLIDLVVHHLKSDELLFDLLVHNATNDGCTDHGALELARSQGAVDTLVGALITDLRPPLNGMSWALSADRIKYNKTVSLGALTKLVGVAASSPESSVTISKAMLNADIVNVIHEALLSPLVNSDEDMVQSLMYILCTLVELGLVDLADMPKDTRKVINNLLMQFPGNEYLANISSSMFQSLTEIFSKGPEAELESIYAHIIILQQSLGAVVEVRDPSQSKCYYYDGVSGESSWELNVHHMELLQDLDTAVRVIEGPLKGDVSNASLTQEGCQSLVALLNSHYNDVRVLGRLLRMVQYQMAVPVQRDMYGTLDTTGAVPYDLLAYTNLDRSWDLAGAKTDPIATAICMMKDLSELPVYLQRLSLREYIIFLNDFSLETVRRAEGGREVLLQKALDTLINLCRHSNDVVAICFEINITGTISEILFSNWIGMELQNALLGQVNSPGDAHMSVFESVATSASQLCSALISGSDERRMKVCMETGASFLTLLSSLTIDLPAPALPTGSGAKKTTPSTAVSVSNTTLLLVVLRLLGIFSSSDACAWYMLYKLSLVKCLNDHVIRRNMHSTVLIIPCLNIFANIASVEVSDGAAFELIDTAADQLHMAGVLLLEEGGFEATVSAMKRYSRNVDVIAASAAVLLNACPDQVFDENGIPDELSEEAVLILNAYGRLNLCEVLVKALDFCVSEGETRSSAASSASSTSFFIIRLLSMLTVSDELMVVLSDGDLCSRLVQIIVDILRADLATRTEALIESAEEKVLDVDEETVFFAALEFLLQLVRSSQECLNTVYMCSGGLIDILIELLKTYLSKPIVVQSVLSLLGILAGMSENISIEVAESGMGTFMDIVQSRLTSRSQNGDSDSIVVSAVFAIITVLVNTESNIRPLIRCGGFDLLIKSLGVYVSDAEVMMAAVVALDLIAAAQDEYLMVFLQKGGIIAVKKVLDNQVPGTEVFQAATSLHLALCARERLLMSSGSKTSRGALLARLKDGLQDVDAMMHEEEVTTTKVEFVDPEVLKKHRNILKAGMIIVDYSPPTNSNGSGGGNAIKRHMQLASDFETLVMKDIVKKSVKGGRRVPLRNLRIVNAGLGPGHYQRMLTGKLKPVSKADLSFYVTSIKPDDAIFIECQTEADRDRWVAAISSLLIAYRHQFVELTEIMSG